MDYKRLVEAGLTKTEALIYLDLLQYGSSSASKVAKRTTIDRTMVYHCLNNLEKKGLVNYVVKEYKKFYDAADPENLLGPIQAKEKFVKELIPKIKGIQKIKEKEQSVEVYEGKEGIRILYTDILKSNFMLSYGATGKSFDILRYEMPHIIKKANKQKFKGRVITHSKNRNHEMTKVKGIKFRFLDTIESQATTTIYKDKVAINVYGFKPLVIIIKDKEIADSYRNYFSVLWKQAKNKKPVF